MKKTIAIILLFSILWGCSNPQEFLEKGQHEKAFSSSLKKLKKNKFSTEDKETLISSLNSIVETQSKIISDLKQSNKMEHPKKAIYFCQQLLKKIEKSSPYTDNKFNSTKESLQKEINLINHSISERYLNQGLEQMVIYHSKNNKDAAKKAHSKFQKSFKYGNINPALDSLIQESLNAAQRIYIISVSDIFSITYSWDIDNKMDDIISYSDKFTTVLFEPSPLPSDFDCNIEIEFRSFNIDTDETIEEKEFEKEIITQTDTSIVIGKAIIKKIKKTFDWRVNINSKGTHNCQVVSTTFNERLIDEVVEVTTEGDIRAIPYQDQIGSTDKIMTDDEAVDELLETFYNKIVCHIF